MSKGTKSLTLNPQLEKFQTSLIAKYAAANQSAPGEAAEEGSSSANHRASRMFVVASSSRPSKLTSVRSNATAKNV